MSKELANEKINDKQVSMSKSIFKARKRPSHKKNMKERKKERFFSITTAIFIPNDINKLSKTIKYNFEN